MKKKQKKIAEMMIKADESFISRRAHQLIEEKKKKETPDGKQNRGNSN